MSQLYTDLRALTYATAPARVRSRLRLSLLDTIGVAIAGSHTELAKIIANYAATEHAGPLPIPFTPHTASATGVALALGMRIDALDGHDGYNPAKGHIGCGLIAGLLALALEQEVSGSDFLDALLRGYEAGARFSVILHDTASDYHTSGAWIAPTIALAGGMMLGLSDAEIAHATGIAEYHGPRSQMMRCINFPTMLKDGSGWGAMAGVSAIKLAQAGFTGAPALTESHPLWADLGTRWAADIQYYKPYPVCRWAQPPLEAMLDLRRAHGLTAADIARIEIETFHESTRLATARPQTTEEAQYSTSFPCAVAMVTGSLNPEDLFGDMLNNAEVLRISDAIEMREHPFANAEFPARRYARVTLTLQNGTTHKSDWREANWDIVNPPTDAELIQKFRTWTAPYAANTRTLEDAILSFSNTLGPLLTAITTLELKSLAPSFSWQKYSKTL
ncbi:MAG: MmgE/PrpD family protein [Pseudomonadota bacterium]